MNAHARFARPRPPMPHRQRGTMLIIALIVLVAMTLAGIATMRSVDTATILSGNIAYRQSALSAADQGLQAGFALILSKKASATDLDNDGTSWAPANSAYLSSAPTPEPDWTVEAAWTGAGQLNGGLPDAGGNIVSFLVHRMCEIRNCKVGNACPAGSANINLCGSTIGNASLTREGEDNFRPQDNQFASLPQVHYRITARAVGPRKSVAIVQVLAR